MDITLEDTARLNEIPDCHMTNGAVLMMNPGPFPHSSLGSCLQDHNQNKRRINETSPSACDSKENRYVPAVRQRRFLQLAASGHVYQTEHYKPKQESLYVPIEEDLLVSTSNIEQISFSSGSFFVGNSEGVYCSTMAGHVIYLWRYSDSERCLYISRSFLVTDTQILQSIKTQLSEL